MGILVNRYSRIVVQGITGGEGSFHTLQMQEYGTNVVAGVTPSKGGSTLSGVPVFDTVDEAVRETGADVSVIFVPARFAADAIMEAADAGVALVVCITEGIPVRDMVTVKTILKNKAVRLVGPNCPGLITPGECKVGIMPGAIHRKGRVGIISKSGTLTYEAVSQLTEVGLGQSSCIGIGGDPIIGTSVLDAVQLFMQDEETDIVVLIGEIGGQMEADAARWIKEHATKPVVGYIAGQAAPKGRRMGHAGAIIGGADDTAAAKMAVLAECGVHVVESPADIGKTVLGVIRNAHNF